VGPRPGIGALSVNHGVAKPTAVDDRRARCGVDRTDDEPTPDDPIDHRTRERCSRVTDPSAASTGHRRRGAPRRGDSRAPVTTVVTLAAGAIAVVAGFLVLRSVTNQAVGSNEVASGVAMTTVTTPLSTTGLSASTTTTTTTTTTTATVAPSVSKSDATVVVANASGVNRSATAMTADLAADGYTTAPVANSTGPRLERSIIYYLKGDPASLAVARLLAEQIPTARTLPMPERPPLDRPLKGATVALMLGTDAAGRPLAELQTG
jgi:LytR cell envelope-related transcriptional attenuator